ncbi:Aste57867_528 [Aphanomyces stellatus]|uniref:Aste57867_528 protein n=1 Tax=Aphanomyces stellatus TaxID=120398 RepID=A0A485K5I3_9STRA|nr:hypothetical protein As57867_000527 [Aphanomyces stellatus]VFT77753.1 Aste57867_528 [Aphanomyces stellatus]
MLFMRRLVVTCLALAAASVDARHHGKITKIVNFGDSTSDTGNGAYVLTGQQVPSNVYYNGRFSNGPTYIEVAAKLLNTTLDSYAIGGATVDNGKIQGFLGKNIPGYNGPIYKIPDIIDQLDTYLNTEEVVHPRHTLYTMWIGTNDANNNKFNLKGADIAASLYSVWTTLAENGAENIMVVVPPFGQEPFTTQFAVALREFQRILQHEYPQVNLGLYESAMLYANAFAIPQAFGFSHGLFDPCCSATSCVYLGDSKNGKICNDPDAHPVWDSSMHPTAAMHRYIGKGVANFVQEWFALK